MPKVSLGYKTDDLRNNSKQLAFKEGSFKKKGGFPILQTDLLIEVDGGWFTLNDIIKVSDFIGPSSITKKSGIQTESSDTAEEHKEEHIKFHQSSKLRRK